MWCVWCSVCNLMCIVQRLLYLTWFQYNRINRSFDEGRFRCKYNGFWKTKFFILSVYDKSPQCFSPSVQLNAILKLSQTDNYYWIFNCYWTGKLHLINCVVENRTRCNMLDDLATLHYVRCLGKAMCSLCITAQTDMLMLTFQEANTGF